MNSATESLSFSGELERHPDVVLNQWLQLGEVGWLTRFPGLSLFCEAVEFGVFLSDPVAGGVWLADLTVGLSMRRAALRDISLQGNPSTGELLFQLRMGDSGGIIQVSKQNHSGSSISRIGEIFGLDAEGSKTVSHWWLDEWDDCSVGEAGCGECPFSCDQTMRRIANWTEFRLAIETEDLVMDRVLIPHWVDRDKTILRVYDENSRCALYLDLSTPGISISTVDPGIGLIRFRPVTHN